MRRRRRHTGYCPHCRVYLTRKLHLHQAKCQYRPDWCPICSEETPIKYAVRHFVICENKKKEEVNDLMNVLQDYINPDPSKIVVNYLMGRYPWTFKI